MVSLVLSDLPQNAQEFNAWTWPQIEPYYRELAERPVNASTIEQWLKDWTYLSQLVDETHERLMVATTIDTMDQEAERRYNDFLEVIQPSSQAAEQKLKEKLLASGLEPEGLEVPMRNMRSEAELFREANLPLLSEEMKLITEFDKITGSQTVIWEGEEITITQLLPVEQSVERSLRERAWKVMAKRQLADREAINTLWVKFMEVRLQLAANANMPDYRSYRWQQLLRFDYTPQDSKMFQEAIEEVVVPAAQSIYERRRQRLGLDSLRPWDLKVDTSGRLPLRPYNTITELEEKASAIFSRVDPKFGAYFEIMRRESLLDLDNRKGKAQGGYCVEYPVAKRPFIFTNAVGLHEDVQTLLHEGGHAFHVFESSHLPYHQQHHVPIEFAEVASIGMELLAAPYLSVDEGGFYTQEEAARARVELLESSLLFWPYMAVVDAFQHWVYETPTAAIEPANCDEQWAELWGRFMPGVDWSGLEQEMKTGWQRKGHIHQDPFYYIEYGLAQLGAVQVWLKALSGQAEAVSAYREALSLGGTAPLPQLFATAGADFAFDSGTLSQAVELMEETITALESAQGL